jgi:hypothetical protein
MRLYRLEQGCCSGDANGPFRPLLSTFLKTVVVSMRRLAANNMIVEITYVVGGIGVVLAAQQRIDATTPRLRPLDHDRE